MTRTTTRWMIYAIAFVLYLLHNDLWFWNNGTLVLGLPVGLLYHALFCVVAAAVMVLLVQYAWPEHIEVEEERGEEP